MGGACRPSLAQQQAVPCFVLKQCFWADLVPADREPALRCAMPLGFCGPHSSFENQHSNVVSVTWDCDQFEMFGRVFFDGKTLHL